MKQESNSDNNQDELQDFLKSATEAGFGTPSGYVDRLFQSRSTGTGKYDYIMTNLASPNKAECMMALQELSEILSIATEDMFHRSSSGLDSALIVQHLVKLISDKPDSFSMDADLQPEIVLLGCRCLYNLIDVNVNAIAIIANQKGIEALVEKLLEIEFIDLAEQILKVLEKISLEYPTAIIKSNAMMASLQYLDFFGIHVQRTALSIICNTCDSLPSSGPSSTLGDIAYSKLTDIIDIIVRLLGYGDQRIVDFAANSVWKIANWVGKDPPKLSQMISKDHLQSLLNALVHSSDHKQALTNKMFLAIGKAISIIVKKSPTYGAYFVNDLGLLNLLRNIIVDGSESEQTVSNFTLSRPSEQSIVVLDILGEILPSLPSRDIWRMGDSFVKGSDFEEVNQDSTIDQDALAKYQTVIFPLLADIFMTSSNITIRKKAVLCLAKPVWFSSNVDNLVNALKSSKKLGKLLFELIHYHHTCIGETSKNVNEERLLVVTGLAISLLILQKCGSEFRDLFIRERIKNEIAMITGKEPATAAQDFELEGNELMLLYEEKSTMDESKEELQQSSSNTLPDLEAALEARLERIRRILTNESSHRDVLIGWTTERYSEAKIIRKVFKLGKEMEETLSQHENDVCSSETIEKIIRLQNQILDLGTSVDIVSDSHHQRIKQCLAEIGKSISGDDGDLTFYEFSKSELTSFFIDFLTSNGEDESQFGITKTEWTLSLESRIDMFMDTMCVSSGDPRTGFYSLVLHLNEHLSRLEKCTVLSANTQEYGMYLGGPLQFLTQLTRQIRLKVTPLDGTEVPAILKNVQISIPAVSSFVPLVSFIKTRLNGNNQQSSSGESDNEPTDDENEDDVDDDDESEIELDDEQLDISPIEEKTIALPSSPERTASPRKSQTKPSESNVAKDTAPKITIYYEGQPVRDGATVFGTIYNSLKKPVDISDSIWSKHHAVTFSLGENSEQIHFHNPKKTGIVCKSHVYSLLYSHLGIDQSNSHPDDFNGPLVLLTLLNALNSRYQYVETNPHTPISDSAFVNNKLNAKLKRQISEPIITISGVHPDWAWSLLYNSGFLLPFETRLMFLRCTGLSHSRNLINWLHYHRTNSDTTISLNSLTKADRLKVKMARKSIFESMVKVMQLTGEKRSSVLEVEFLDEVGSGLGPTLEFFALVSEAVRNRSGVLLKYGSSRIPIWRAESCKPDAEMLNPLHGLYPSPIKTQDKNFSAIREIFTSLGAFVAKAFLDSRHLDLSFHWVFLEQVFHLQNRDHKSREYRLLMIKSISSSLYSSLKYLLDTSNTVDIDELMLDFTLPGNPEYELVPNGSNISVTTENVTQYVDCVIDAIVGQGVQTQIQCFREGFERFIPTHLFDCFTVEEIGMIVGGEGNENWDKQVLLDAFKADHGYNINSRIILELAEMLSSFNLDERRSFLSFCTGSPKLPIGGFAALHPPLTIVCKQVGKDEKADDCLPSVMTCAHYLKVPEYSSAKIMQAKFKYAIQEGKKSFYLS